jgi:NAD(P)-dependent dehydrogenase (short-subunit alcohol dehydrogenase family)
MGGEVAERTPDLHGLVNNCGIIRKAGVADTGDADWEPQMSINLRAPALCAKVLLPLLVKGAGSIVNVSSEVAFRPLAEHWVYSATKSAIRSLTRSMACEFASLGIRANCIAPGWTVTEMHYADAPDPAARKKELEAMVYDGAMIRRLGRPEEMAAAIAFLLSDDASFITSTTLHVDGGRVAYWFDIRPCVPPGRAFDDPFSVRVQVFRNDRQNSLSAVWRQESASAGPVPPKPLCFLELHRSTILGLQHALYDRSLS